MITRGASNFEFNDAFFAEVGKSPEMESLIMGITNAVATTARATASVKTGAYLRGIKTTKKEARYRVVGVVEATDAKSLIIESKTGNLARALKAQGRGRRG